MVGELGPSLRRVQIGLALRLWYVPESAKRSSDRPAAVFGEGSEISQGTAYLLPLRHGETLHGLRASEDAFALAWGHAVELSEPLMHAELDVRLELAKTGLGIERSLLLIEGQVAMALHPLRQMLLVRVRPAHPIAARGLRRNRRRRHALNGSGMLLRGTLLREREVRSMRSQAGESSSRYRRG